MSDRNFFRLAVSIPLEIDVVDAPLPVQGTLVDISEGGCKIAAKQMLLKGVELAFCSVRVKNHSNYAAAFATSTSKRLLRRSTTAFNI